MYLAQASKQLFICLFTCGKFKLPPDDQARNYAMEGNWRQVLFPFPVAAVSTGDLHWYVGSTVPCLSLVVT